MMTLLAMIRCSESRKLDMAIRTRFEVKSVDTYEDGSSSKYTDADLPRAKTMATR